MATRRQLLVLLAGLGLGTLIVAFAPFEQSPVSGESQVVRSDGTTTTTAGDCEPLLPAEPPELNGSLTEQSVDLSRALYECADTVLITRPAMLHTAIRLGHEEQVPVLVHDGYNSEPVTGELRRLEPSNILTLSPSIRTELNIPVELVEATPGPDPVSDGSVVWLLGDGSSDRHLLDYAAFFSGALAIDAPDLDGLDEVELEAISGAETVVPVGFDDPDLEWRLSVLRSGMLNPGGGVDLFDGTRLVAFYGNPAGPALGVLGEQGPEATLDRLLSVAAEYEADGLQAVPTFEIITTVASSEAGADGDYSSEMTIATLQPWVDVAAEAGVYVLLDLQSGRRGDSHHQAARRALPLVHTRRRRVGGT